jgi:hypothetical protein
MIPTDHMVVVVSVLASIVIAGLLGLSVLALIDRYRRRMDR